MLPFRPVSARPAWQLHAISLVLILATSMFLLWIMRDGPPNRAEMAIIIGVLVITPSILRWQIAWMMLFLFLPFVSWLRRVQSVIDPSAVTENFDVLLLFTDIITAIAFVGFLLTRQLRKAEPIAPGERAYTYPLTFYVILCVVQIFNPMMGSVAAGINGVRSFLIYVSLFVVTRALVTLRPKLVISWITATVLMGLITGAYGMWQYLVWYPDYDMKWANASFAKAQVVGDIMRAFSTFSFTSTFSHYMIIGTTAAIAIPAWKNAGRFMQVISPFALLFCIGGLGLTFVRSSFMGVIIAVVVAAVVAGEKQYRARRMIGVLTLGCTLLFISPSNAGDAQTVDTGPSAGGLVAERLMTIKTPGQEGSVQFRLNLWSKIFQLSLTLYPAGVGLGGGVADRFGGDPFAASYCYTESQFISELTELGWAGFVLFLWLTFYGVAFAIRTYDQTTDPDRRRFLIVSIMWQTGLMVAGITGGTILYTQPGSSYYWAAVGLAFGVARANEKDNAKPSLTPKFEPYSGQLTS